MPILELPSIQKKTAEAQATELLRAQITSGRIVPASRITEIQLAEQLRVSRPTVRAALHQLSSEGLIVQIPYTGWVVASLTAHDAWELYTLRAGLEGLAARLAAGRMNAERKRALGAAFKDLRDACKPKDWAAIAEADFALHHTVVRLAGHKRLEAQYCLIEQHVRMYIVSSDALSADARKIVRQHRGFVNALLAEDAGLAERLIAEHITQDGELMVAQLERQVRT